MGNRLTYGRSAWEKELRYAREILELLAPHFLKDSPLEHRTKHTIEKFDMFFDGVKEADTRRPDWDDYFLAIAEVVATRATCDRKLVGCVIADEQNRIVSTGYNGAPAGMPHCDKEGHLLKEIDGRQSCVRTLHAESNALDDAGRRAYGGSIYITVTPCFDCAKRIVQHKIKRVVWGSYYASRNTDLTVDFLVEAGVKVVGKTTTQEILNAVSRV